MNDLNRLRSNWTVGLLLGWVLLLGMGSALAEQRFPPPEFESGYHSPTTTTPPPQALALEYTDAAVLVAALILATWLVYRKRSRRGVVALSLFSLLYFGFYRQGCVCAIGSVQNVALALGNPGYAVPITVLVFFVAPLVVSLFFGRTFCSAVCPHGALQDVVLIKPLKVPGWLEQGLSVVPFLYLGAAILFAVTGSAFIVCRYDPFVPLFRLSASLTFLIVAGVFVVASMFVGRPYCRFLCPFGALLKLGSRVSKWRVRVTPDICTQCRLCQDTCPFGAMRVPTAARAPSAALSTDRRRLGGVLVLLPVLVLGGGWMGSRLGPPASQVHPTVAQAEQFLRSEKKPVPLEPQTAPSLALKRARQNPRELLAAAGLVRNRFVTAGGWFGGFIGLAFGLKLLALALRQKRTDYEPDQAACFACARCFSYCPNERVRLGLVPETPPVSAAAEPASAVPKVKDNIKSAPGSGRVIPPPTGAPLAPRPNP
jgi:NosR/NirI family transcriptional regulator, nitrous oxide reductase regulator